MAGLLRLLAVCLCAVVALGFVMFAADEMDRGSKTQQQAIDKGVGSGQAMIAPPAPTPQEEYVREQQHGNVREAIDDANDLLLAPFSEFVSGSKSHWVTHGVPALLGLLIYGVGLGLLANLLPQAKTHAGDWRTA
jgi:hypothetical protein